MPNKTQKETIQELVNKTLQELSAPKQPLQESRVWKNPQGYSYLVQWSNTVLLRYLTRLLTSTLPRSEYRRKTQVDDAARSVVRNIEEGWKRTNTLDYLTFLGFSQGSLEEVKGDIRDLTEDRFLPTRPGTSIASLGINLKDFNSALKPKGKLEEITGELKESKGDPKEAFLYHPLTILYPPLAKVCPEDLTYEIFFELINKTDYLLRVLVQSLEKKLAGDQKYYQVERARIRGKII